MYKDQETRPLKELLLIEWSGSRLGIPAYGGLYGHGYACCPVCNGVKPYDRVADCWPVHSIAHREDCALRAEIIRALDVERKRMLETVKHPPIPNYVFSFRFMGYQPRRDGQHLYTMEVEHEGLRAHFAITRAEMQQLQATVTDFLALDGVE